MLRWLYHRLRPPHKPPLLTSQESYARWSADYPAVAHNALMRAEQSAMESLMPDPAGLVVLDLACGTGRYGRLAEERGARRVIGLDNSRGMLAVGVLDCVALASLSAIPLATESVDLVLCGLAMGHVPDLHTPLEEISRILKKGGCALVSDFHPLLALSGGQRTFTASDGKTYAVEHYPHLYADYHQATTAAGLRVDAVAEPRITDERVPAGDWPVALVLKLVKAD